MYRLAPKKPPVVIAGLCIALLHIACASTGSGSREAPVTPTVWSVQTPGSPGTGHLFLLGSVKVDPEVELGPVLSWAFSDASELVFEVDYREYGQEEGARLADRFGRIPRPQRLEDQLTAETRDLLEVWLARRGLFSEPFEQLQPWLVATAVSVVEAQAYGFGSEQGIDRILLGRAQGRKSVVGLESLESQLEGLSALSSGVQDLMLRDRLERSFGFTNEARDMRNAWQRGDDEALARILLGRVDDPEFAEFYERSLFDRSQRMADRIATLPSDGKTRLVVVDAAHMLGDRGIPALLLARGFDVRRATTQ